MKVSLTPRLDKFIKDRIKDGRYDSPSEVVRDALLLLEDHEYLRKKKLDRLRADVKKGLDDLRQGRYKKYDREGLKRLFENTKSRGRKRLAALKRANGRR